MVCRRRVNAWLAARLESSDGHFDGYVVAALQQTHCNHGGGKVGVSSGGVMGQSMKESGAKVSILVVCNSQNLDLFDQGKPMAWVYTLLLEAKVHMKESGEMGKRMVLANLPVPLVKRYKVALIYPHVFSTPC